VTVNDALILLLVLPIVIVELGLIVIALRDLLRPERRVRGESKVMWGLLIVFVGLLGPILYLTIGRQEE
jgi:Phospholipase_D-nuclease N-terminal